MVSRSRKTSAVRVRARRGRALTRRALRGVPTPGRGRAQRARAVPRAAGLPARRLPGRRVPRARTRQRRARRRTDRARARPSSASSRCTWRCSRAARRSTRRRSRRCPTRSTATWCAATAPRRSACSPATRRSTATRPVVVMTTEVLRNMLYAGSSTLAGARVRRHGRGALPRRPVPRTGVGRGDHPPHRRRAARVAVGDGVQRRGVRRLAGHGPRRHRPWWSASTGPSRSASTSLYAASCSTCTPATSTRPTPGVDPPINPDLSAPAAAQQPRGGAEPRRGPRPPRPAQQSRPAPARAAADVRRRGSPSSTRSRRDGLLPAIVFIFSRAGCQGAVQQCLAAGVRLTSPAEASRDPDDRRGAVRGRPARGPRRARLLGVRRGAAAAASPRTTPGCCRCSRRPSRTCSRGGWSRSCSPPRRSRSASTCRRGPWCWRSWSSGTARTTSTSRRGSTPSSPGRAGRRGIDTEGHAVVVAHPGLDPVQLAGLASKRLYPLRSSFRPTYNMAVNLVAQVGRDRAREVLETSFAQFQADRGVVGLARQAQAHAEALDGYAKAMECHQGDFAEYAALRRADHGPREGPDPGRGARPAGPRSPARSRACASVTCSRSRSGDGRATSSSSTRAARPGSTARSRRCSPSTARCASSPWPTSAPGARTVGFLRVPKGFTARVPGARRDLAARSARRGRRRRARAHAARTAPQADPARRGARTTPRSPTCGAGCARTRATAARTARSTRAGRSAGRGSRASTTRSSRASRGAPARSRPCSTASATSCCASATWPVATPTAAARRSRSPTTGGGCAGSTRRTTCCSPSACAAACSTSSTRPGSPPRSRRSCTGRGATTRASRASPAAPTSRLGVALDATVRAWSELDDLETAHKVETTQPLDTGPGRGRAPVGGRTQPRRGAQGQRAVRGRLRAVVQAGHRRARPGRPRRRPHQRAAGRPRGRPSTPCGTGWWRTRRS